MSISKALVELMGGEIGVQSQPDIGSQFYFTLPLCAVLDDTDQDERVEMKTKRMSGTVLIAEDDKTNQMLLTILLKELGLESVVVNDGLEAVEAVKNGKYDLILMDENMPNMNGTEAAKIIRTLDAVTANALKGDREKFIENGMDDYLSKPVDTYKLESMFKKYL